MFSIVNARRRLTATLGAAALIAAGGALVGPTGVASADTSTPATPVAASAAALPTWQISGVAWSQVVVGNTVYVTGNFTKARPPGVEEGGAGEVAVGNLLAYDIRTGARIASFNHTLNAQGLVVKASPDGKRLYVGGDFTVVDGKARSHVAAFDLSTGKLDIDFQPSLSGPVRAIAATNDVVYLGGSFEGAQGVKRKRLAAFTTADGEMTPWAPTADDGYVWSLLMTPDQSKVLVSGAFTTISGKAASGTAALDPSSAAVLPWAMNSTVRVWGDAAITNLSTDGTTIYGGGYVWDKNGNLEGTFAADPATGALRWVANCLGDTYDTVPLGGALYVAGHAHDCSTIGGFNDAKKLGVSQRWQHAFALTTGARKPVLGPDAYGFDFRPQQAPDLMQWYPDLGIGVATGQSQAGWSVTGNDDYVTYAGEFPTVNGTVQQGLVRFARTPSAAGTAPQFQTAPIRTLTNPVAKINGLNVDVKFQSAWDMDTATLTYQLVRDRGTDAESVVATTSATTNFWTLPDLTLRDPAAARGEHTYSVKVSDGTGNVTWSNASAKITVATTVGQYPSAVLKDGADHYWRLGQTSGAATDAAGTANGTVETLGVTRKVAGAISGDADYAMSFDGRYGRIASSSTTVGAATSMELWLRSTSTKAGRVLSFETTSTTGASVPERQLSVTADGRLSYRANDKAAVVTSTKKVNTGAWVHVVATIGAGGLKIYADGEQVAADPTATPTPTVTGKWAIAADSAKTQPFAGGIDEVATYPSELTATQVKDHARLGVGKAANVAPKPVQTATVTDLGVALDGSGSTDPDGTIASYRWDFGDGSAAQTGTSDPKATHTYAKAGTYTVTLTVTDDSGATATATASVTVTAPAPEPTATPTATPEPTNAPPTPAAGATIATDAFARTVTGGWGSADTGGSWSYSGARSLFDVAAGAGTISVAAGTGPAVMLRGISSGASELTANFSADQPVTGGGLFVTFLGRGDIWNGLGARVWIDKTGTMRLAPTNNVDGSGADGTDIATGLTYSPGTTYRVKVEVTGTATTGTSRIRAKLWPAAQPEPQAWTVTATDDTAALQGPAGVGVSGYLSKSATTPIKLSLSALTVRKAEVG